MGIWVSFALLSALVFDVKVMTDCVMPSVPKYVFWVSDYPKTASGKIQKFKLREEGVQFLREGKGME